jgi:hypothetical protein
MNNRDDQFEPFFLSLDIILDANTSKQVAVRLIIIGRVQVDGWVEAVIKRTEIVPCPVWGRRVS